MQARPSEETIEERTLHILREIFGGRPLDNVSVRLWDGTTWPDERARPAVLTLKHPDALGRMFLPGTEVGLAEAYLRNDFDVEGNIETAFEIADFLLARLKDWKKKLKISGLLVALPDTRGISTTRRAAKQLMARVGGEHHSPEHDRWAVRFHYDVSNDFYRLWLDRQMVYSCAYFRSDSDDLETAQERKLDYLCRKLRLQPGQGRPPRHRQSAIVGHNRTGRDLCQDVQGKGGEGDRLPGGGLLRLFVHAAGFR